LLAGAAAGLYVAREAGAPAAQASGAIELRGLKAFDPPPGDGAEHDDRAAAATDGDAGTAWTTETYRSFGKPGVGLVLDAGRPVAASRLTLTTDTPGFTAEIRAGASPDGPFAAVSTARSVGAATTFELSVRPVRYYLVWITNPGPARRAHLNEVKAS
jgi:hypothetical protein